MVCQQSLSLQVSLLNVQLSRAALHPSIELCNDLSECAAVSFCRWNMKEENVPVQFIRYVI